KRKRHVVGDRARLVGERVAVTDEQLAVFDGRDDFGVGALDLREVTAQLRLAVLGVEHALEAGHQHAEQVPQLLYVPNRVGHGDEMPARLQDARELRERAVDIGDVVEHPRRNDHVEARIGKRQVLRVTDVRLRDAPSTRELDHAFGLIEERDPRTELCLHALGELPLTSPDLEHPQRPQRRKHVPQHALCVRAIGIGPERLPRAQVRLARVLLLHPSGIVERHHAAFVATNIELPRRTENGSATSTGRLPTNGDIEIDARTYSSMAERESKSNLPSRSVRFTAANSADRIASPFSRVKVLGDGPLPTRSRSSCKWNAEFVIATSVPPGRRTRASSATATSSLATWYSIHAATTASNDASSNGSPHTSASRASTPRSRASSTIRGERSVATTSAPVSRASHSASSPQPQPTSRMRRGFACATAATAGTRASSPMPAPVNIAARRRRRVSSAYSSATSDGSSSRVTAR